jgi:hypothetical protein
VAEGEDTSAAQALAVDDVEVVPVFPSSCALLLK